MSSPVPSVESVLRTLRRSARHPREAVEAAVKQLLAGGGRATPPDADRRTYRVDDLARASGVTVRNIRAYQERGLLPAPQRVGRTALFDDTHLARLKILTSMLDRGYTAANIREMLAAWEQGHDLGELLGLESALVPSHSDEPVVVTLTEARRLAGGADEYERLLAVGLVELAGTKVRVLRPRLLESFAEMREHGMTTEALLRLYEQTAPSVETIARLLVEAGTAQLAPRFFDSEPATEQVAELVGLLTRFRDLAMTAVTASVAAAIEQQIEEVLAGYLATVLDAEDPTGS